MKNETTCRSCNTINAAYRLNCTNCNAYLRDRVVNIDLWHTFSKLTSEPADGFKLIRNSEHKNFILLIFMLAVMKLMQNTMFLSLAYYLEPNITRNFFLNFVIIAVIFSVLIVGSSFLLKFIAKIKGTSLRFLDNLAIILYSFFPYAGAFIILLPLEYVIFGEYLFTRNPSWFVLNTAFAWLFTLIEAAFFIWSSFLLISGLRSQTNNKLFSVIFGLVFIFITYLTYFVVSKYLFM